MMLCDHIYHVCCTYPRRTCPCVACFLQSLVLELSLLALFFLVCCFVLTLFYRSKGFISWGPCIPSSIFCHWNRLSHVYILLVRYQKHLPLSHLRLSCISTWSYWTSNLGYTFHWTICKGIGLCPWSYKYYTCLSLHLDYIVFHLTPHTGLWVPSTLHVHSHFTASPTQKVYLSGWLLGNPKPWCFLNKYSLDLDHLLHILRWVFPTLLWDNSGFPCVLQLI